MKNTIKMILKSNKKQNGKKNKQDKMNRAKENLENKKLKGKRRNKNHIENMKNRNEVIKKRLNRSKKKRLLQDGILAIIMKF